MDSEKGIWEKKYAAGSHNSQEPDPFLLFAYEKFVIALDVRPAHALDIAGGAGRHSIWLAQQSWNVTLVDVSKTGIALARQNAANAGVDIKTEVMDLDTAEFGTKTYDLIMVFYYLQRELFPILVRALKPHGIIIYKTYTLAQLGRPDRPRNPLYLLQSGELREAFSGLKILHYSESNEGRATAEVVAHKK